MPMRAAHRAERAQTKATALWPLFAYLQEPEECSLGDSHVEVAHFAFIATAI